MNRIHLGYTWHGDHSTWAKRLALVKPGDIVVLNPSNGPQPDDALERAGVASLRQRIRNCQATALGYIHLSYGDRPYSDLFEDLRMWQEFGVFRYFFDEAPVMTKAQERRLVGAVQGSTHNGIKCVFNPGTAVLNGWEPDIGNLAVTWEGPFGEFPTRKWRSWEAAIAYGLPEGLGRRSDGPLWQAWTNDNLPNPYDEVK